MSVMSWFSMRTTTSWSKLPVASGDKCPGGAIGTGAAIGTRPDPSSATTTRRIAVRAAPRPRLRPARPWFQRERRGLRTGADAGNPRGESGHQRRERLPTLVAAISGLGAGYRKWLLQSGTVQSARTANERRIRRKTGRLQIVRLVSFLDLGFEFLPPVPRLLASPRVPAVTATDQDEAHGGEDHDEQGEGPRDPEGEIREGQGGGFDVKRSRGGRLAARVVDRLHPDLVGTVGQVEGGARCGADG